MRLIILQMSDNSLKTIFSCIMPKKHSQPNKVRKRRGKDLDEIIDDMKPHKSARLLHQPIDVDIPGNAQFYCLTCARYFVDQSTIDQHSTTKAHKRRIKMLKEPVYTQREADAAGGLGIYTGDRK
jgi:bud site selection protein 20